MSTTSNDTVSNSINAFITTKKALYPIKKILIANNGNAAAKFAISLRDWCLKAFDNENEIELVGMVSPDDEDSNAEYIARCDYIARVQGGSNNFNYANIDQIVECAKDYECDAVWPGWGHASENEELARVLEESGKIIWIGPASMKMQKLGCKIASTIIAQSLGIPVLKWSGSHINVLGSDNELKDITNEDLISSSIVSLESLLKLIENNIINFPFLLKASTGGGGKGIRLVTSQDQVEQCYRLVVNEVPSSLIFAMNCLENCKHIEVQVIADKYGDTIACGARDCSIQRRHQKIIEEAPPLCCSDEVLKSLYESAIKLCQAVRYENAGTVEFLYDIKSNKYYFLEVNTRLQVEHVVSELLIKSNLVAAQIQVAMGVALKDIDVLQNYFKMIAKPKKRTKHCIAVRIIAENTENNFQPATGKIDELTFFSNANVWGYFGVVQGGKVHQYCDSHIGHIFSIGDCRESARKNALIALSNLIIRGEISTNILALSRILMHKDFINNVTTTRWLETTKAYLNTKNTCDSNLSLSFFNAILYAAVYKAIGDFKANEREFEEKIAQGQVPGKLIDHFTYDFVYQERVKFVFTCYQFSKNVIRVYLNNTMANVRHSNSGQTHADHVSWYYMSGGLDNKHRKVGFQDNKTTQELKVRIDSETFLFTKEKDSTQLVAQFSAKLVRWLVPSNSHVTKTTPIAEIELMKMYIQLYPEENGKIIHVLAEGAVFQTGDLLATMELDSNIQPIKPKLFENGFMVNKKDTLRDRIILLV